MRRSVCLACLLTVLVSPLPVLGQSGYEASSGVIQPRGFVLFLNAKGPLSYLTLTPGDLPPGAVRLGPVKGRGCQFAISTPIARVGGFPRMSVGVGVGGYQKALRGVLERHPDLKGIYDVKIDVHVVGVLTVFQRQCTEITAQGFR